VKSVEHESYGVRKSTQLEGEFDSEVEAQKALDDGLKELYNPEDKSPTLRFMPGGESASISAAAKQNHSNTTVAPQQNKNDGMLEPGNIDVSKLPIVKNEDGSVSTIRSISIREGDREILIPTVIDGKVVSNKDAIAEYHKTGRHLGVFNSVEAANRYARELHKSESARIASKRKIKSLADLPNITEK
jgi:hypothetical protein